MKPLANIFLIAFAAIMISACVIVMAGILAFWGLIHLAAWAMLGRLPEMGRTARAIAWEAQWPTAPQP